MANNPYGSHNPYAAYPPTAPPGMAPPPGMPGVPPVPGAFPPGMPPPLGGQPPAAGAAAGARPGFPPNFQPPPSMPNINFLAPVIRLGTSGPGKGPAQGDSRDHRVSDASRPSRAGLGASNVEAQRQSLRDSMLNLQPPTKDEILRTIFIGGITQGVTDDDIERILRTAGGVRRWIRPTDAHDKPCKFGFAEFEDPESLKIAVEVLTDIYVPVTKPAPRAEKAKDDEEKEEEEEENKFEKSKLLVVVDDATLDYLGEWESRTQPDPSAIETKIETAKTNLQTILTELETPPAKPEAAATDKDGDTAMAEGTNGTTSADKKDDAEVVTIPLGIDEELADIPPEMRATVAKEIAAFRERSNRRDQERLRREEEIEQMERARAGQRTRSPPPTAPTGPAASSTNGIPVGPRGMTVPTGPKALSGQPPAETQLITFIHANGLDSVFSDSLSDDGLSDWDLEQRRRDAKTADEDKYFLDQERRWLNRERSRTAAIEREKVRDMEEDARADDKRDIMARRLREYDDTAEASRKSEEYYADHGSWLRTRTAFRQREMMLDDADRVAEERETAAARAAAAQREQEREAARGLADDFLARQAEEIGARRVSGATPTPREPQRFKLSLGAAAQKAQQAHTKRRTMAEVEGLLEDEEDTSAAAKRKPLTAIKVDMAAAGPADSGMTEEERQEAVRHLAAEIPNDTEALWAWDVKWEFVDESVLTQQLKPFVEKKIVEYLGVQEQMLVDVVEEHIRQRGKPQELVEQLAEALDEEAEVLVKKLWRMIIFFSESEKRGLGA